MDTYKRINIHGHCCLSREGLSDFLVTLKSTEWGKKSA